MGRSNSLCYLSAAEAFRTALGQLLVYGATHFSEAPRMVMFLDQTPGERLLRLADTLGIAVVVETTPGVFELRSALSSGADAADGRKRLDRPPTDPVRAIKPTDIGKQKGVTQDLSSSTPDRDALCLKLSPRSAVRQPQLSYTRRLHE